jgi:hypothetical protein
MWPREFPPIVDPGRPEPFVPALEAAGMHATIARGRWTPEDPEPRGMRISWARGSSAVRALAAALLTAFVLGTCLTGCSRDSAGKGTDPAAAAWAAVTSCIRTNGMPDWPDPTVGSDGQLGFPEDAPHTTQRVQQACAAQFAALPVRSTASPLPTSSADMALLFRLAQCLRLHGYPSWPDPGPDGRFAYSAISGFPDGKRVLTGHGPDACRTFVPPGGIHVAS